MRKVSAQIWILAIVTIIIIGLAAFLLWPKEEEVSEKITPPDWIVWNVPEGQVDPEMEREVRKAVNKFFGTRPEEYRFEGWQGEEIVTERYFSIEK